MDTFRSYVKETGIYGRGTNLGAALEAMLSMRPEVLNGTTTLLILSDAKTVDEGRALSALIEAKRRSARVLWLNPIPENKWQYLRHAQLVQSVCTMIPCSTLRELAAACRRLTQLK